MADDQILPDVNGCDKLAAALAKAQRAITPPKRSHTAKVATRTGGEYSYTYTSLEELVDAIREPAATNDLAYIQRIVQADRQIGVETILLHGSGQMFACGPLLLPSGDTPQGMGSALSYARRYSLGAAFGVASAEQDDDGATAERETRSKAKAAPKSPSREPGDEPPDLGPDEPSPAEQRLATPVPGSPTISEARQRRLFAIAKGAGWTTETLKTRLQSFGYAHTRDIPVAHYDDIIADLQAAGGKS